MSTSADFARLVEPSVPAMSRYAARQVGPAGRDDVVRDALVRAWRQRATYDESRGSPLAWLLAITDQECRRPRPRRRQAGVVELVEGSGGPVGPDPEVDRALDHLDPQERRLVDLRHFVGLDLATVAEVARAGPEEVEAGLRRARTSLCRSTGQPDDDRMDRRLASLARRWQEDQPPPPEVPVDALDRPAPRRAPRVLVTAAVVVALAAAGGVAWVRSGSGRNSPPTRPVPQPATPAEVVPWRDLEPSHPAFPHDRDGLPVTPYDQVVATGAITGSVGPGDTLEFDVGLTAPGVVGLHPCPDYTVTFGTHSVTRRLNCAQAPYYAAIVRPDGRVTAFRPVLPAGVTVFFRMSVVVPSDLGRQRVAWTLDGPRRTPGFDGVVTVR